MQARVLRAQTDDGSKRPPEISLSWEQSKPGTYMTLQVFRPPPAPPHSTVRSSEQERRWRGSGPPCNLALVLAGLCLPSSSSLTTFACPTPIRVHSSLQQWGRVPRYPFCFSAPWTESSKGDTFPGFQTCSGLHPPGSRESVAPSASWTWCLHFLDRKCLPVLGATFFAQ